ncbi:MAG: 16S rRNA (guanine(527)-N(7))-methyltransferase RsmG [Weeping tea tree witches'-broom phytoplasma]|uniref:16S rRNA (guanine(527)-N(7))-methyltransferase RsmG n=1 Tax=Candidatus Phytoplasma melaleucae TaxID=2982630 RepID=UPI00293A9215|nr:16S rRNA (guanine(527)-N(7))-methyltransferase RsmG [Weeping tea tree witches'-broom phytoplasma]
MYNKILQKTFNCDNAQLAKFQLYYSVLLQYNIKMNLTSLLTEKSVYLKHFYDSLLISKMVRLGQIKSLCDVGTGAGFPGIPLKILYPHLKIFLIDSSYKKTLFLKYLVRKLNLTNVFIFRQTMENYTKKHEYVITRALGKLNNIYKSISSLVKNEGYFIAMKGPNYKEELKNICIFSQFQLKRKQISELPEQLGQRVNLLFQKKSIRFL